MCDRFLDPLTSAQPITEFISPQTLHECLSEAATCRSHTQQGRMAQSLKRFGILGRMYQNYTNPTGYKVFDDGKLNPKPFLQARYEALIALRNLLEEMEFRKSEHYERYEDEVKRVKHEEEEKLQAVVGIDIFMYRFRNKILRCWFFLVHVSSL